MKENETTSAAAQMRAIAEQAEAEAAEAEALAAAARARARAIQLRRDAQQFEESLYKKAAPSATPERPDDDAPSGQTEAEPAAEPVGAQTAATETLVAPLPEFEAGVGAETDDTVAAPKPDVPPLTGHALTTSEPDGRPRPLLSRIPAALAVLAVLALSAASGWMVLQHRHATQQRRLAAEYSAAARQGVVTLTSLDFNNAKAGVQHILENSTGSFKDDFAKMAGDFAKVVEQSKVVEQGTVQATAVDLDKMSKNSAVVLVASTSEVTNAAGAKQDPRTFRLIVTVTRDGDQLKMSKVEFVP